MIVKKQHSINIIFFNILLFVCLIKVSKCLDPPHIEGELNMFGKWIKTQKGLDIMGFLGIPFAKPPNGERRFKDPEPYGNLEENFNATVDSDYCPQFVLDKSKQEGKMSEDCLKLNVYTRNLTTKSPVVVWIHGGQFIMGGGQSEAYGPQYLLDKDIVLVSLNYRLGVFGFLSTKTETATGNYGLKDQVLALKWVQKHIEHFGGDKNSVTIFGQSAGGWSVSAHLVSPMSKGLFHKAIAFSGSTTSAYSINNRKWTIALAGKFGCSIDDSVKMVNCLRKVPWKNLTEASNWRVNNISVISFNIEVEKDYGQERFLIEHPSETMKKGNFHKVPILLGTTKNEFDEIAHALLHNKTLLDNINQNFNKWAPLLFTFEQNTQLSQDISRQLKEHYFKNELISEKNVQKLSELFSDSTIIHGVHRLMELARKYVDVYFYRFDYKGRFTCGSKDESNVPRFVAHTDDLTYLFVHHCAPQFNLTDNEQFMVNRLNEWVYNFAKSGKPSIEGKVEDSCSVWPATNKKQVKIIFNDEKCKVGDEPYQERMKLWDKLFPISKGFTIQAGYLHILLPIISLIALMK